MSGAICPPPGHDLCHPTGAARAGVLSPPPPNKVISTSDPIKFAKVLSELNL